MPRPPPLWAATGLLRVAAVVEPWSMTSSVSVPVHLCLSHGSSSPPSSAPLVSHAVLLCISVCISRPRRTRTFEKHSQSSAAVAHFSSIPDKVTSANPKGRRNDRDCKVDLQNATPRFLRTCSSLGLCRSIWSFRKTPVIPKKNSMAETGRHPMLPAENQPKKKSTSEPETIYLLLWLSRRKRAADETMK